MTSIWAKWGAAALIMLVAGCGENNSGESGDTESPQVLPLSEISERYVKLILGIGEHEPGYVDAYYGPEEWAQEIVANPPALEALTAEAGDLIAAIRATDTSREEKLVQMRVEFLAKQLIAADARLRMLAGEDFSFDEETRLLFDAVSPGATEAELDATLAKIDALIPGDGPLDQRFIAFRDKFVIPPDKLDAVFQAAIKECRARTAQYIDLPEGERFTTEYVTGKSWSGYNWYQGHAFSLIQVNTDFPIYIDRAVDLGCHEGYPGHHVYNALLEQHLVDRRGWIEFSVYPLYSPQSLLAEGTANLGIEMAFPGDERLTFETEVLYPLAGLDPAMAATYAEALKLINDMRYARTEGARRYLDGRMTRDEAIDWMARYRLESRDRAAQSVQFIDDYRGYIINYTLGLDLSRDYVDRHRGTDQAARWSAFETLLTTPETASMLME